MKNFLFLLLILVSQSVFSQEKEVSRTVDNTFYTTADIDVKPEFPGGVEKMYGFIGANFKMPENRHVISGKIFLTFIVEIDGSISNVNITRDIGYGMGNEGIRVIKMFPKWKPGEKNGEKVRVQYSMPISIN